MASVKGKCPICDTDISLAAQVEESEIINCPDCQSRVVVEKVDKTEMTLAQAPEVEEDWGE